jgi:DNA ligase-1
MVAGALTPVARAVFQEGAAGLDRFRLEPLRPIVPMLAQSTQDVAEALATLGGEAGFEYKLDGARVQVHKAQEEVRIYTRRLREITPALPEIIAQVRALSIRELVADGEVIALDTSGRPYPFQVTMRRFGRREGVESLRARLSLSVFFFDVLFADGAVLIDEPAERRLVRLSEAVSPGLRVPRLVTSRLDKAEDFLARARAAGHEGVMAKSLKAPYVAGRRGSAWLKIKLANTLDLVVLAAEWGSGRRQGWLSNLHLGARDGLNGGFVMLGKTFKGLTDEMLKWQTAKLLELEIAREDYVVVVRPELVVEIAFNDLQVSPQYPGGLALRFARVKGYRHDKTALDADTIDTV